MNARLSLITCLAAATVALTGCTIVEGPAEAPRSSGLFVETYMALGNVTDVAGFLFEITCADGFAVSEYVSLEDEFMPDWLSPGGLAHSFADFLTMLPPGECHVVATPMQDPLTPSEVCPPVEADVIIVAEQTTEIVMISQCEGEAMGAGDFVAGLNTPPVITDIDIDPSKFIWQCETAEISIDAMDNEGDDLTYTWEVTLADGAAEYTLFYDDDTATFSADTPGYYEITVTVTDTTGATTQLTFPIHVSDDPDIEHCADPICCETATGFVQILEEECEERGGAIAPVDMCTPYVCCRRDVDARPEPFTTYELVLAVDCADSNVVDMAFCAEPETNCCRLPDGSFADLTDDRCKELGGGTTDERMCEETCCAMIDAATGAATGFTTVALGECAVAGGIPADEARCEETCCRFRDGTTTTVSAGDCALRRGTPVGADECREASIRIEGLSLDADAPCPPSPYVVIASSAADELAVYDTTTLLPLPTSPFATCDNPSRILMLPNTDVVASCRDDGRINRHTRDGVLHWSTQLPGCGASRGVTFTPAGRLFASCYNPGMIYELDPATGAVLSSTNAGQTVYGLASDWDGLYVCSGTARQIILDPGGPNDMLTGWVSSPGCYGIATDGAGGVWTAGGVNLVKMDSSTGAITHTEPMPGYGNGVIVGPNGVVHSGMAGSNAVFSYDPVADVATTIPMPTGHTHPRGVTVDSDGNAYAICLASHTVVKIDAVTNATTPFGGGILNLPYNYGGDQAGINFACVNNVSSTTVLAPIDGGSATATWLNANWSANVPTDTSILIDYRIDGGAWHTIANLGATPALTSAPIAPVNVGQTLEFQITLAMSPTATTPPALNWIQVTWNP